MQIFPSDIKFKWCPISELGYLLLGCGKAGCWTEDGGTEIKGWMRGGQKDDEAAAMVNLRVENAVHSDSSNF